MKLNLLDQLPELLNRLIAEDRWKHPGDDVMKSVIPSLDDPVEFLLSKIAIEFQSTGNLIEPNERENQRFHEYRGSRVSDTRDLPWIDVEKKLFLAVNRNIGDDVAIALDFRTDPPRIIASIWREGFCFWEFVANSFEDLWRDIESNKVSPNK